MTAPDLIEIKLLFFVSILQSKQAFFPARVISISLECVKKVRDKKSVHSTVTDCDKVSELIDVHALKDREVASNHFHYGRVSNSPAISKTSKGFPKSSPQQPPICMRPQDP
jgi:hypothetical protein